MRCAALPFRWSCPQRSGQSKRASSRSPAVRAKPRHLRLLLAGSVSGGAACVDPLVMAQASPTLARSPEPARLNLSGRALRITAPLLQGDINLGDVDMMVAPDDTISLQHQRLLRSAEHKSELQSLMRISYA